MNNPLISVENILGLATKHGVKLSPGAISSDAAAGYACARGILAIEAYGTKENFIQSHISIYSREISLRLNCSYKELTALELGLLSDEDETTGDLGFTSVEEYNAYAVGQKLQAYVNIG